MLLWVKNIFTLPTSCPVSTGMPTVIFDANYKLKAQTKNPLGNVT